MLASYDDVLPPPGDIQVLLLTLDSVSLSWSSPQGLTGPQTFRVTWGCDGETSSTRVKGGHHLEISSLQPGKKYQFSVAIEGEDGSQSKCVSASLSTVVPPRDFKIDHLEESSFTLHWSKAEGMEKWWKRPSRVAAVCVLLAVIIGLWDSYATLERDQLQNSLNTRTTERDQLQNSLNTRTME
ncbi:unnamed protein product, partial [Coregonus sp. 'balchen']